MTSYTEQKMNKLLKDLIENMADTVITSKEIFDVDENLLSEKNRARLKIVKEFKDKKFDDIAENYNMLKENSRNIHISVEYLAKIISDSRKIVNRLTKLSEEISQEENIQASVFAEDVLGKIKHKEKMLEISGEALENFKDKIELENSLRNIARSIRYKRHQEKDFLTKIGNFLLLR